MWKEATICLVTWWPTAIIEVFESDIEDLGIASRAVLVVWVVVGLALLALLGVLFYALPPTATALNYFIVGGIWWVIYGLFGLGFHQQMLYLPQ